MYFISLYLNDYVCQNQGFGFQFQTLCHVATPTMFWYDPLIHAWQGGGGGGGQHILHSAEPQLHV